jgi:hypothetical protein
MRPDEAEDCREDHQKTTRDEGFALVFEGIDKNTNDDCDRPDQYSKLDLGRWRRDPTVGEEGRQSENLKGQRGPSGYCSTFQWTG